MSARILRFPCGRLRCALCHRRQDSVGLLASEPRRVYICDPCAHVYAGLVRAAQRRFAERVGAAATGRS